MWPVVCAVYVRVTELKREKELKGVFISVRDFGVRHQHTKETSGKPTRLSMANVVATKERHQQCANLVNWTNRLVSQVRKCLGKDLNLQK